MPEAELSAGEQAAAYSGVFELLNRLNHSYEIYIENLNLLRHFGLDVSSQEKLLSEDLLERAANGSILLEMTMANVTALQASVSVVPDDAEIKAKLNVAINHVSSLANGLAAVLVMMDSVGMDTNSYQEQLPNATGQITTDVFEVGVFTNLFIGWGQTLWSVLIESGPGLLFKIVLFFIIVYIFRKLADLVQKLTETGLAKSQVQLSLLLQEIVDSQEAVLNDPETVIRMHELGDSSVNFIVRPWVNMEDYWETYWAIIRAVKLRFDEEGISIPFPQSDVHLYKA